jgi:hypothetical protein
MENEPEPGISLNLGEKREERKRKIRKKRKEKRN